MDNMKPLNPIQKTVVGVQFLFVAFGATVLVPLLVGLDPSTALFTAGIGTLIFHLVTKGKVPIFLGSSFAFVAPIIKATELYGLPGTMSGLVAVGTVYGLMSLLVRWRGIGFIKRLFPPVVIGPVIILIGLSLAGSGVNMAKENWPLALVALLSAILASMLGRGMLRLIPIFCGIIVGYLTASLFGLIDFKPVIEAPWFAFPQFVKPSLSWEAVIFMIPVTIAPVIEHIGDVYAINEVTGKDFVKDPGLHRTLIGDGLATSLSALVGGPANTTYGENTGVLELSKVHDPKVIRIAALYAIILSFIPKIAEVIGSMPSAIIGGVSFMLYGMISAIGVRNVVENHVDFTKSRNLIIAGVIFVSALGFSNGLTFTVAGTDITLTSLAIAAIAGILLNAILPGNDYHFGKDVEADSNRGIDMMPNLHEDTSYGDHEE